MQLPANDVPNYGNTFAQASTTLFTSTCYHSPIAIREERNTVFNQATNGKKWNPIPTGWTVWNHVNSQFLIEIPMFVWLSRYFQLFDIVRITILTFFGVMKSGECCWENCIYPTFSALETASSIIFASFSSRAALDLRMHPGWPRLRVP